MLKGIRIPDDTVDLWQANTTGRYRHPHDTNPASFDLNFQGWVVVQSGQQGSFHLGLPGFV